jgi:hypothetical protein
LEAVRTAPTVNSWCEHLRSQRQLGEMFAIPLLKAVGCGFRAFLILPAYDPADLARGIRPFVDLLLTRRWDSKKPHQMAGRKALIQREYFGCGGRI